MPRPSTISFDPATDIPDLSNKVLLITGGTAGLGTETILQLSKHNPARILFTGRNTTAAENVIKSIRATNTKAELKFIQCDFSSLQSVYSAAKGILDGNTRLDILICNAGIMAMPKGLTADGYEIQFGVNHLAHALLIKTLLPLLLSTSTLADADVRIVSTTSLGAGFASTISFDKLRTEHDMSILGPWRRYGESKLANILYVQQLAKRYPVITSTAVHPGVIYTGLVDGLSTGNRWFVYATTVGSSVTLEEGAKNQVWAATGRKGDVVSGRFYEPVGKVGRVFKGVKVVGLAGRLWEWTEGELKGFE
ncbi:dehydrogenase with different specificitie [Clohesyomyces aquaticus]|uniref:Dehydrogenase with different specificitie n=1 Tax=Clohesyomyces aquaticus TaxID=1231657 RepID=A0A1Y1Y265_9PLEO|nr:dehydrogenase with different specificitie [Clohesyomyces aquaticus]